MHIAQFLKPLLGAPHVVIVKASLPERPARWLAEQFSLPRVSAWSPGQQGVCGALLQHLHHRGRGARVRLGDQKVDVLRHHHVADHDEVILRAGLFQDGQEAVTTAR